MFRYIVHFHIIRSYIDKLAGLALDFLDDLTRVKDVFHIPNNNVVLILILPNGIGIQNFRRRHVTHNSQMERSK